MSRATSDSPSTLTRRSLIEKSACGWAALAAAPLLGAAATSVHATANPPNPPNPPSAAAEPPLRAAGLHPHTPRACLPREVAGIRIPDSSLARASAALVEQVSPPTLYNHCLRTYVFAALVFQGRGVRFDEEQTFVGSVLHDLGLIDDYMTETERFEIDGADAAVAFLKQYDVSELYQQTVWDAIAVHVFSGYAQRKQPEIAAVSLGAGMDVGGFGLDALSAAQIAAVLEAFPRLDFKRQSIATVLHVCEKKPLGTAMTALSEVGRQYNPDFPAPTLEQVFLAAPFDE